MLDCPKHPEFDLTCILEDRHGAHLAWLDGEMLSWDTINPAAAKRSKRKPTALDTQRVIESVTNTEAAIMARHSDPETSSMSAEHASIRTGSHKHRILGFFAQYPDGLIPEEAAGLAEIDGGWKRVSDLLNEGRIEDTGRTRLGSKGEECMVCVITDYGRASL